MRAWKQLLQETFFLLISLLFTLIYEELAHAWLEPAKFRPDFRSRQ
jgi:hypothetical protein